MTTFATVPMGEAKTALGGNLRSVGIDTALLQTPLAQYVVLGVGLLLFTWWLWAHFWPEKTTSVTYDTHLSEAFAYAITGRWGRWMSDIKSPETDAKLERVLRNFQQAAADGQVTVWGKPTTLIEHHFGSFTLVEKIDPSHWASGFIGWDGIRDGYARTHKIDGLDRPFVAMIELRVNRREFARRWPARNWLDKIANRFTRKSYAPEGIGAPTLA